MRLSATLSVRSSQAFILMMTTGSVVKADTLSVGPQWRKLLLHLYV